MFLTTTPMVTFSTDQHLLGAVMPLVSPRAVRIVGLRDFAADHVAHELLARHLRRSWHVMTSLPSRSTVMRSEICSDSSSACEM